MRVSPFCALECDYFENFGLTYDCPDEFDDPFLTSENMKCIVSTHDNVDGVVACYTFEPEEE